MKLISITATILLAFCMACSTTDPIPEPEPSHPSSSAASVPVIEGPSDLLASHDPLPQLSTEQASDTATDHSAMQQDESPAEHDHGAMAPASEADATEAQPPAHDHSQHDPAADEPESPPADSHDDHAAEPEQVVYVCPMHPEQKSNEPADCPICGMKMEPVEVEP